MESHTLPVVGRPSKLQRIRLPEPSEAYPANLRQLCSRPFRPLWNLKRITGSQRLERAALKFQALRVLSLLRGSKSLSA